MQEGCAACVQNHCRLSAFHVGIHIVIQYALGTIMITVLKLLAALIPVGYMVSIHVHVVNSMCIEPVVCNAQGIPPSWKVPAFKLSTVSMLVGVHFG